MESFVLPIDKPRGMTSHDVVARARGVIGVKRIGHTGTLDPFATGLLLLCVGSATRIAEYLSGMDKHYEAVARLGLTTDSHDSDGAVVAESDAWRDLGVEDIRAAAAHLVGRIRQRPPALSAKKVGGERAHRLARAGQAPRLDPVEVTVHELTVDGVELPEVSFRVHCGSGTYVRALARDLGERLGCGAHLTTLRRTRVGDFQVDQAMPLKVLESGVPCDGFALEPARALAHLSQITVDEEEERALAFGRWIEPTSPGNTRERLGGEPVAALRDGRLVAIGGWEGERFKPRKVFTP